MSCSFSSLGTLNIDARFKIYSQNLHSIGCTRIRIWSLMRSGKEMRQSSPPRLRIVTGKIDGNPALTWFPCSARRPRPLAPTELPELPVLQTTNLSNKFPLTLSSPASSCVFRHHIGKHVCPSGGFSLCRAHCVKPVQRADKSRVPSMFQ